MKEILGLISAGMSLVGCVPYIVDVWKKKTKPHIFSWIIWTIVTLLAFFGQLAKGAGAGAWSTGVAGFMAIIVTILSIKNGTKNITKLDAVSFMGALIAIALWYLTKDPTLSILLVIALDMLALFPTARKTYKKPKSETFILYLLNFLRQPLSIFALQTINIATIAYPVYLFITNGFMIFLIKKSGKTKWKK